MRRLFSKIATLSVGLAMAVGVGVAVNANKAESVKANSSNKEDASIIFNYSNESSDIGTNVLNGSYFNGSNGLLKSATGTKAYCGGTDGLRIGTGSATGSATFTLRDDCKTGIYVVTITTAQFGADTGTLSMSIGGNTVVTGATPGNDIVYECTNATITSFSLATSAKRAYIKSITASYNEPRVLNSVEVSGTLTKASYYESQTFDPAGLTFTAKWSDGDVVLDAGEIAKIVWAELKVGDTSVKGTYEGVDFTVNGITVSADVLNSIAVTGTLTKSTYYVGDNWDRDGLVATGTYAGKGEVVITDKVEWSFDPATATSTSVTSVKAIASLDGKSGSLDCPVTVSEYAGYVRVADLNNLRYGDTVLMGVLNDRRLVGSQNAGGYRNSVQTNNVEANYSGVLEEGLPNSVAVFTLVHGSVEGTYAFHDGTGYLAFENNTKSLKTVDTLVTGCNMDITIVDGVMHIRSHTYLIDDEIGEIKCNTSSSNRICGYKNSNAMPTMVLYKKNGSLALSNVFTFLSSKLKMEEYIGDNTYDKDRCDANYAAAKIAYAALSEEAKNLFGYDSSFAGGRTRLKAWAAANGEEFDAEDGTFTPLTKLVVDKYISGATASYAIIIIVATVSITALGVTLMVLKKKKHN